MGMKYQNELGNIVILKNGEEVECEVLFTFDCEELGKTYVGYTDGVVASNGRKNIYVKRWDPVVGTGLEDIMDKDELDMVVSVLKQIEYDSSNYYVNGGIINE